MNKGALEVWKGAGRSCGVDGQAWLSWLGGAPFRTVRTSLYIFSWYGVEGVREGKGREGGWAGLEL